MSLVGHARSDAELENVQVAEQITRESFRHFAAPRFERRHWFSGMALHVAHEHFDDLTGGFRRRTATIDPDALGGRGLSAAVGLVPAHRLAEAWSSGCEWTVNVSRRRAYESIKRVVDVLGSAAALLILAPVMAAVALLIKATSRGPALYIHRRVGRNGRTFTCYKFRTMVLDADRMKRELACDSIHDDQRSFKIPRDPRITKVGAWLRRTSLDELPQLFNVLRGDMSLVGPRPALPTEVDLYSPRDRQRLVVQPGITCIWQISGRSRLPFPEQLELDLRYIRRRSMATDIYILMRTVPAVLSGDGAY